MWSSKHLLCDHEWLICMLMNLVAARFTLCVVTGASSNCSIFSKGQKGKLRASEMKGMPRNAVVKLYLYVHLPYISQYISDTELAIRNCNS